MTAVSEREFIDTNVLVYAYDESAGDRHSQAKELLDGVWDRGNGALSIQVLQEFFVTVTRRIRKRLDAERAAGIISDLGRWAVHSPGVEDLVGAIGIHRTHQISFWDALIIQSARQLDCGVVWSEDLQAGRAYDGVLVRSPFA